MRDDKMLLTRQEILLGWHFCCEFDGLLMLLDNCLNESTSEKCVCGLTLKEIKEACEEHDKEKKDGD